MPRPVSPASDQEEGNDALLSEELERYRNQYRNLKNDRAKYIEETQIQLKKYNDEIQHLERDNENLRTLLEQAESTQNRKQDNRNLEDLKQLASRSDEYSDKIEEEKQTIATLNAEIRKYERMKRSAQKQKGSSTASKDQESAEVHAVVHRKIRVLENRLDKENNKYNNTLTENGTLRDDIEKLRNERVIYKGVHEKLVDELESLRRDKQQLTDQATAAYEQRDEANNKCLALKDKNEKDRAQFDMEMRDLHRIVDHDIRLREFMNIKANERAEWKKIEEERRRQHGSAGDFAREQQRQKIDTFEEAFKRIREITDEDDLDLTVQEFIKHEDENFAYFQYVSELNNQVENLHEEIEGIQEEILKYRAEEVSMEEERQRILRGLEIEMSQKKTEADRAEGRLTEVNKILDQLRTGVKSLFTKIGCDDTVILEMLGGDSDVTDRNVMLYLGSIEQRTNSLLAVEYYMQMKKFMDDERTEPPEHGMTLGIAHMPKPQREGTIMPPVIGEDFEESSEASGDEVRPLSQHELMNRVMKDIKKRELAGPHGSRSHLRNYEGKKSKK